MDIILVQIVGAIFVGLVLAYAAHRFGIRRFWFERKVSQIDDVKRMQKANVFARLERERVPGKQYMEYFLHIENEGPGEARNITMKLDGKPLLEHPAVPHGVKEQQLLGPKSFFKCLLAPDMDHPLHLNLEITWSDESGESGNYHTTLG